MFMAELWQCMVGPRLTRILDGPFIEGRPYKPNKTENWSDGLIKFLGVLCSVAQFTCPLIVPILFYKRDSFTRNRILSLIKCSVVFGVVFIGLFGFRGFGRYKNLDYRAFLVALNNARLDPSDETKLVLSGYDFCFWAWPIDFRWNDVEGESKKELRAVQTSKRSTYFEKIRAFPCDIASNLIATHVGRRLLYPGSLQIIQSLLYPQLLQGRIRLQQELGGNRYKLLARDNNEIDVMVIDRRNKVGHEFRDILVICCEGNAGFYEMGIVDTPLKASYSVLGWNHPGFGGSTGLPFPDQELNAVDVVMQFALHRLGFKVEDIVVYGWSIGGFTATWLASKYPDIHGLILDATFDDVLPLARAQMPEILGQIVSRTIRDHLNLVNIDQLCQYPGPVLLIRRTSDEVITTNQSLGVKANRGNFLLIQLLQQRYPKIFKGDQMDLLLTWLSLEKQEQFELRNEYGVNDELCETLAWSATEENETYPSNLGEGMKPEELKQMTIFLASKYMTNFDHTHCQPLPADMFAMPWRPMDVESCHSSPFDTGEDDE